MKAHAQSCDHHRRLQAKGEWESFVRTPEAGEAASPAISAYLYGKMYERSLEGLNT